MNKPTLPIAPPDIDSLFTTIRGQKVILDADLARVYQVPTKALNRAIKRNQEKFPDDFLFRLTRQEAGGLRRLRSQFVTLKPGRGQHRKYLPLASEGMREPDPDPAKGWGRIATSPFPGDFLFQLTREERDALTSQIAM